MPPRNQRQSKQQSDNRETRDDEPMLDHQMRLLRGDLSVLTTLTSIELEVPGFDGETLSSGAFCFLLAHVVHEISAMQPSLNASERARMMAFALGYNSLDVFRECVDMQALAGDDVGQLVCGSTAEIDAHRELFDHSESLHSIAAGLAQRSAMAGFVHICAAGLTLQLHANDGGATLRANGVTRAQALQRAAVQRNRFKKRFRSCVGAAMDFYKHAERELHERWTEA